MATTLRRSRSKYGRTRRQRINKKRISGGGFIDDLVKKFQPSTDVEKCQAAKEAARIACSNKVEGDIEMMPIASSSGSGEGLSSGSGEGLSSTASLDEGLSPVSGEGLYPVSGEGLSSTASLDEGLSPGYDKGLSSDASLDYKGLSSDASIGKESSLSRDAAVEAPVAAAAAGGAKKSKKNNKKRRQSRRKKFKSRKHKK
jgi:hypothetical protein